MTIEAMKQALEALNKNVGELRIAGARHILRTAIAEAEKAEPVATYTCGVCGVSMRMESAAAQQEPVAWRYTNIAGVSVMHWHKSAKLDADIQAAKEDPLAHKVTPLYTTPPAADHIVDADKMVTAQRHPLVDRQITRIINSMPGKFSAFMKDWDLYEFARAIEAAHDIK